MYFIELHNGILKIVDGYNRLGLWNQEDKPTVKQAMIKIFYSVYSTFFTISLVAGALSSDKKDAMFLAETAIITTAVSIRLFYVMWSQTEISKLLHRIGVYSVKEKSEFTLIDNKVKNFMKWITYLYIYAVFIASSVTLVLPFIGSEKKLFFNIGFPFDYKNNDLAYWIAFLFLFTQTVFAVVSFSFSIIIWYLMFNCGLKYHVLGSELENLGVITPVVAAIKKRNASYVEKRIVFKRDLIAGMESYEDINKATNDMKLFFSEMFSFQLATSAILICTSVFNLGFNKSDNIMEYHIYMFYLFYSIFDIFMVMYFGNEIDFYSNQLSYCLFKSNWMDQSQSCKKTILIFGERLKQRQQLVLFKIYPLTLETFTRILKAAYNMFNILKTLA